MWGTLSILGLYNYDTSIFENFVVPEGVDAATAINSIIYENAELEIIYPDPEAMKFFIGLWSSRESVVWARILNAITRQYNPIENYNRTETWTDTEEEESSHSASGSSTEDENTSASNSGSSSRTPNLTNTRTPNLTKINTHEVAAFNGTTLVTSTKDTDTETGTDTQTQTGTESGTTSNSGTGERDLTTSRSESGTGSRERSVTRSGNVSGNIGVTTSQQMINQELDIAGKVDIYKYISESFKHRFCLMVY